LLEKTNINKESLANKNKVDTKAINNISQNNDKIKVPPFADFESNLEPIFLSLTNEEANELVKESPKKNWRVQN